MALSPKVRCVVTTIIGIGLCGALVAIPAIFMMDIAHSQPQPEPQRVRAPASAETPPDEVRMPPGVKVLGATPHGTVSMGNSKDLYLYLHTRPMTADDVPETHTVYSYRKINNGGWGECPGCPQPPPTPRWVVIESR